MPGHPHPVLFLVLACALHGFEPLEVTLAAPLSTVVELVEPQLPGPGTLSTTVVVPADAPAGLGVGAWCADAHGRWFQVLHPQPLVPGRHELTFAVDASAALSPESRPDGWDAVAARRVAQVGLLFWSTSASRAQLRVTAATWGAQASPALAVTPVLRDCVLDGHDGTICHGRTGERWQLRCRPEPLPEQPYDERAYALDLVVTQPDGRQRRLPGFWQEPLALADGGNHEAVYRRGAGSFMVRFRPEQPGRHLLRLEQRLSDGPAVVTALPDLQVAGQPWNEHVRIDPTDPRFFCVGADHRFYWPLGINIRSVWDLRSHNNSHFRTRLTPERGSQAYAAYFARLAASGGDAVEIWLASWNFGLEWRADWRGFHGLGDYGQENGARLDAVLDEAWRHGIRINLVIYNHGMASAKSDRQWPDNPFNILHGGPAADPLEFFTLAESLAYQQRYRRYLVARYADHPAILGWKLFSEVNLTAAKGEVCRTWFAQAARAWHDLDAYDHPVALHWSGDWKTPDRAACALPEMDYICIDAYHRGTSMLAGLIHAGTQDPLNNLSRFAKPVLATEYGGSSGGCPPAQLAAELATAPWAGLMSGNAGAPMTWWWEWVDQNSYWQPYTALRAFLHGEDLRSRPDNPAGNVVLSVDDRECWCSAWFRPGRLLGHVLHRSWATNGGIDPELRSRRITIGEKVAGGTLRVQWHDADRGGVLDERTINHPGGELTIESPAFARQLAFKLWREDGVAAGP